MIEIEGPVFNLAFRLYGEKYERKRGFFSKYLERQSHGPYHHVDDYEPIPVPKMSVNWTMLLYRIAMANPMSTEEFNFSVRIVKSAASRCLIDGSRMLDFKHSDSIINIASRSAVLTAMRTPLDIWPNDWGSYNFKRMLYLTRYPKSLAEMFFDIEKSEIKSLQNFRIVESDDDRLALNAFIREYR